jgi:hypothetical protein
MIYNKVCISLTTMVLQALEEKITKHWDSFAGHCRFQSRRGWLEGGGGGGTRQERDRGLWSDPRERSSWTLNCALWSSEVLRKRSITLWKCLPVMELNLVWELYVGTPKASSAFQQRIPFSVIQSVRAVPRGVVRKSPSNSRCLALKSPQIMVLCCEGWVCVGKFVVFTLIISLMSCEITQKILKINNLTVCHI